MKANCRFLSKDLVFWANIKLINQRLGYTINKKSKIQNAHGFRIPTVEDIKRVYISEGLDFSQLVQGDNFTEFGSEIVEYMEWRANILFSHFRPNLMDKEEARELFTQTKTRLAPRCDLPFNKQKDEKRDYSYLTGLVNMLIEENIGECPCNYSPLELTAFTKDKMPARTLSRRVDGAFPAVINPYAVWEIKEYYYTTTFGSRIADGVYETQLDGYELKEVRESLGIGVDHYLIIDARDTWWEMGKSYLCRIVDTLQMGLLSEVIIGREVITRIPQIAKELAGNYRILNSE